MNKSNMYLTTADYVVIVVCLFISATIGVFFKFFGKQQNTNEEYLLAGKNMAVLPVAFSMMATFSSATTLMGIPAEMYLYGTHMAFMNIGFAAGMIWSAYFIIPLFFQAEITTAYQFLEQKLGTITRRLCSLIFLVQSTLFASVTLYAPALALNAVTGISTPLSVVSTGIICTFYCTLGGMKAVLWADVFQSILMFLCILAIIIKGALEMGGIAEIFRIASDGGRIVYPKFSTDVSERYTMWNILLQSFIIAVANYSCSQVQVQRMLTVKNVRRARRATYISVVLNTVFHLSTCVCGIVFYAYFHDCDPMKSSQKAIHSPDQLMPYFILSTLHEFHGLPGLCIAGIFSASLSTISSQINSSAASTLEDFIRPIWKMNDKQLLLCSKLLTLFYGCFCIALTFLIAVMGNLVQVTLVVNGIFAGPLVGIFLLAVFFAKSTEKGVIMGAIIAVAVSAGLTLTGPLQRKYEQLPISIECPNDQLQNGTKYSFGLLNSSTSITDKDYSLENNATLPSEYGIKLSYMWISSIGLLTCIVIGSLCSLVAAYFSGYNVFKPYRKNLESKRKNNFGDDQVEMKTSSSRQEAKRY